MPNVVQQRKLSLLKNRITSYDIPIQKNPKNGPIEYSTRHGLVLDWTINMFKDAAEKTFKKITDPHATKIRENTIEFEKWARKNKSF